MRLLALACVLAACQAGVPSADQVKLFDEDGGELIGFLEKFKDTLKHGNEHLGIPVLDPLEQQHLSLNLSEQGEINLQGALEHVLATGLSAYKVIRGDFTIIGLKANASLLWDQINITAKYNASGTLADYISVYGSGDLALSIQGLAVSVDLKLSVRDKKLYVAQLALHAHVQKVDCNITGLYNDDDLSAILSRAIGEIIPGLVEDYQNELSAAASPLVANMLSDVLKNMSIKDLLDLLDG